MSDERSRWTDERLDDRFEIVDETVRDLKHEIHALRNLPNAVSNLATELRHTRGDVDRGFDTVRDVGEKLDGHIAERRAEDEQRRKERKADRKFLVTTILGAVGVVIAAVALFAGHV